MIEIRHNRMDNTTDTQQAYNQIYQQKGILLHDSFYLWLISLLKAPRGSLLLDISCGQGRLVTLGQQQGLRVIGTDFALKGLKKGQKASFQTAWVVGDGEFLPIAPKSVDYVTHIGSLEHYQNPEAGIAEIRRILKPGGVACILLPNTFSLLGNVKYSWKTGGVFDDMQPLQRYNTRAGWQRMLVENGLIPFRTLKYEREWPRTWPDLLWYLTHIGKTVHLLITRLIPLNLANCFVYLCHPAQE